MRGLRNADASSDADFVSVASARDYMETATRCSCVAFNPFEAESSVGEFVVKLWSLSMPLSKHQMYNLYIYCVFITLFALTDSQVRSRYFHNDVRHSDKLPRARARAWARFICLFCEDENINEETLKFHVSFEIKKKKKPNTFMSGSAFRFRGNAEWKQRRNNGRKSNDNEYPNSLCFIRGICYINLYDVTYNENETLPKRGYNLTLFPRSIWSAKWCF